MSEDKDSKKKVAPGSFLKGFATGVTVVTLFNKFIFLGLVLGLGAGIYCEQAYPKDCPDIGDISTEYKKKALSFWRDHFKGEDEEE